MGQSWFCHLCSGNGLLHLNHSTMGAEKAMRGNAWFKLKKSRRFTSLIDQKSPFDARKKDLKAQQRYTGFNRIKFDEVIFSDRQVIHRSTDSIALRLHRSTQIHSSTESTAQQLHDAFSHATCPLFDFFVSFSPPWWRACWAQQRRGNDLKQAARLLSWIDGMRVQRPPGHK